MGIKWISTQGGLNTFDGIKFKNLSLSMPGLQGSDFSNIYFDSSTETAFVSATYQGIYGINTKKGIISFSYVLNDSIYKLLPDPWIRCISKTENYIWIGTQNGLVLIDIKTKKIKLINPGVPKSVTNKFPVRNILHIENKFIAVMIDGWGVMILDNKGRVISEINNKTHNRLFNSIEIFQSCFSINHNKLVIVSDKKALLVDITNPSIPIISGAIPLKFQSIREKITTANFQPNKSEIWIATTERMIIWNTLDSSQFEILRNSSPFLQGWAGIVNNIFFDRHDNVWVSTENGLWAGNINPSIFLAYDLRKNNSESYRIYGMHQDQADILYATTTNGILKYNFQTQNLIRESEGVYTTIIRLIDGQLITASENGLKIIDEKNNRVIPVQSVYPEWEPFKSFFANSLKYLGNNRYIISAENDDGLLIWELNPKVKKGKVYRILENSIHQKAINNIKVLNTQEILILADEFVAKANFITGEFYKKRLKGEEKEFSMFFDAVQTENGYLISSYGNGIIKTDEKLNYLRIYNEKDGLSSIKTYQLDKFDPAQFIVTSDNGLSIIRNDSGSIRQYFFTDGLHSNGFEEGSLTKFNKNILVGGLNGFTIILPENEIKQKNESSLFLYQLNYKIAGKGEEKINYPNSEEILPNELLEASLSFRLTNLLETSYTRFFYRINAKSEDWIPLEMQPEIKLMGMGYGQFLIELKSINLHNPSDVKYLKTNVYIPPPWYQTTWFKVLLVLATASLFYALYRYRLWQIQKEYRFKEKIAADLHDDLGSTLTGVKLYTELGVSSGSPEYYGPVKQGLTEASLALREMIWVLDTRTNTAADIIKKLERNVQPMLRAGGIQLDTVCDAKLEGLACKTDEKRDLYLLLKEFVNNSVKYSGCTRINLQAKLQGRRMQLEIADNGKGFNPEQVQRGNGLRNMEIRANRCRYAVAWETGEGRGTKLVLTPL